MRRPSVRAQSQAHTPNPPPPPHPPGDELITSLGTHPRNPTFGEDPHLSGLCQKLCCSATCHGCWPEATGATPTKPPPAFHSQIRVALSISNFSWECGFILRNSWRAEFFTGVGPQGEEQRPHVPGQGSGDPGSLGILRELEGRRWPAAGLGMRVWGPCVASRDRWLHEANLQDLSVKTPVLSEGHR